MKNKKSPAKTKEEVLDQLYISAYDLQVLMPITYANARKYIDEIREDMENKKYKVPEGKTKLALTSMAKKKFGF